MPYLFVCALIANAASFVLPISNPANLVIYGAHLPPLLEWLPRYALPSLAAIAATFVALYLVERRALRQMLAASVARPALSTEGQMAAAGVVATAAALMAASTLGVPLGLPTAACGVVTMALALARQPSHALERARAILGGVSWSVLPLVAGLFVLVQALQATGAIAALADQLRQLATRSEMGAAWTAGIVAAIGSNLINNLPAGLIAGHAVQAAQVPENVTSAVLMGVDLGPNLSVTGSLATILWLVALRRAGFDVGALRFLKVGALVMPPALLAALAALLLA